MVLPSPLSRGSRASLRPSPISVKDKTADVIKTPGAIEKSGTLSRYEYPVPAHRQFLVCLIVSLKISLIILFCISSGRTQTKTVIRMMSKRSA